MCAGKFYLEHGVDQELREGDPPFDETTKCFTEIN